MSKTRDLAALVLRAKEGWLESSHPRLLICFSHLRWDFVFQRPQHLLTRAAADHLVVVVEEPSYREGAEFLELRPQDGTGVLVAVPMLRPGRNEDETEQVQRELVDALLRDFKVVAPSAHLTFWYYTAMALGFTDLTTANLVVYDCMDELSAFRGAPARLIERERDLLSRADLVFAGGQSLHEAKAAQRGGVHLFASSIDKAHFTKARAHDRADPADQAAIPHPRIGFFGVIDERMDTALVGAIAERRPDWQLVMIGPVVKIDPKELPHRPNIHWLGGKSYKELPDYLAGWDLGFMPFALNASTKFISPTKTPEFLAAGLPVVSTPIRDVVQPYGERGLVAIAAGADAFVAAAETLLAAPRAEWLGAADDFLAGTSWDRTWGEMRRLMGRAGRKRPDAGATG